MCRSPRSPASAARRRQSAPSSRTCSSTRSSTARASGAGFSSRPPRTRPVGEFPVQSQGAPIPPADRDRIFEPYHRGRGERRVQGAGLGSTICRSIVERHGGQIGVTASPGGENRFNSSLGLSCVQGQITPQSEEPAEDRTTMSVSSGADRQWDAIGRTMAGGAGDVHGRGAHRARGARRSDGGSRSERGSVRRPRSAQVGEERRAYAVSTRGMGRDHEHPAPRGVGLPRAGRVEGAHFGHQARRRVVAGDLTDAPAHGVRAAAARTAARPETIKVGPGVEAYYFAGLTLAKGGGLVDVYVLPTTAGVVTVACLSDQGLAAPHYDCWRNAATLQVRGGRALRLGPDTAFRQRLPGRAAALDDAREQARAGLAMQVPGAASGRRGETGRCLQGASGSTRAAGTAVQGLVTGARGGIGGRRPRVPKGGNRPARRGRGRVPQRRACRSPA